MARTISVQILGDSRDLEKAFARSARSAQKFNQQVGGSNIANTLNAQTKAVKGITAAEEELIKVRSRRASSLGPFRFAGVGLAAGLGLFAATQAVRELGDRLEVTGKAAFTTEGRLRNMVASLTSGNLIGAFEALRAAPKTIEDLGVSAATGTRQINALKQVASGATAGIGSLEQASKLSRKEIERLVKIQKEAGTADVELSKRIEFLLQMEVVATTATEGLADSVARMGQEFLNAAGDLVTFKGAADDVAGMRGPGARAFETPFKRAPRESIGPLSPSQRRELGLIGTEGAARLPALTDRLRQLNNQIKRGNIDQTQRLKIRTNIANTEAEIAAIYRDQAAAAKAAADAGAAAAEAAAAAAEAARLQKLQTKLGWLEFGLEKAEATKTIKDNLAVLRDTERYWLERILTEGRILELVQGLWRTRQRISELGKSDKDPLAGLMQVSTAQLTARLAAGTGLTGAGRRVLGANISGQQIQVYSPVILDGQVVARNTSKHQARGGNRTGNQTSGRRA